MNINRKPKYISFLILFFLLFYHTAKSQNSKIGFIDGDGVIASLKESQEVKAKLEAEGRKWEQDLAQMQAELEQLQKEYESQRLMLSEQKKQERLRQMQELNLKMNKYYEEKFNPQNGEYVRLQSELLNPIMEKVQVIIEKVAAEEKYDFVFDASRVVIVFVSEEVKKNNNLTERVIEELNKDTTQ